ncbi:MAG: DNA polymerase IV, partial [Myxococcota bacterium]|nr:DNA polymerase IV [Myxococcota bacterium]
MDRKILHLDMDAFFASVEQLDDPALRGRPVIVGGNPRGRGVVAAASYEARVYGIRSAMPCAEAARLCPHAVFLPPDRPRYQAASARVQELFRSVTPLVEPISLDEAYLDVTTNSLEEPLAGKVAIWLKRRIKEDLGLTASAGVAPCKLVAKIASDLNKPDGLVIVTPERVLDFLAPLPVKRLWGVGPATARRLQAMGVTTVGEIRQYGADALVQVLGEQGRRLQALANGIDERPVRPEREPRSRGAESTYETDVTDVPELLGQLSGLSGRVSRSLRKIGRPGRTITLKVRYSDFSTISRSHTLAAPMDDSETIERV